jgi:hypothetical protein
MTSREKQITNELKRYILGLLIVLYPFEFISQKSIFERQRVEQIQLIFEKKYDEVQFDNSNSNLYEKSKEVYNLLLVSEQEILMLLRQDYEKLLLEIMDNEEKLFRIRNNRNYLIGRRFMIKPYEYAERAFNDDFSKALLKHLNFQSKNITRNIQHSTLKEEERLFLIYFLHLNIYYGDECSGHFEGNMLEAARVFSEKYPSSKYLAIIKKYSKYYHSISSWGRDFSITGLGISAPIGGNGPNYFHPMINYVGLSYGWNYKNVFVKYEISFAYSKIKNNIFEGYKHLENSSISGRSTRYYLGYSFYLNDKWKISPFLGLDNRRTLGLIELESNHEIKKLIYHDENSLMAGVNIDFKFEGEDVCHGDRAGGLYHRIQLGLSSINAPFGKKIISSRIFFMQYSIGIQSQRARRVKALPDYMYL